MTISFDITDAEADIIAEQYAFSPKITSLSKEEFVVEQFKKFGRDCILGQVNASAAIAGETLTKNLVDTAKTSISF